MEPTSKDHPPRGTWGDRFGDAIFLAVALSLLVALLVLRFGR